MDFMPPPATAPEAVMFLSPLAVALAACMLLVGGAVSMQLNLALHTQLLVAGIRMVLQLLALGYILVPIFAYNQAWLVLAYALFMLSVATSEASARSQYTYKGVFMHTLASMALSAGAMLTYTVLVVLARHPWWDAQYVIPILGMILGNATSGISVGLSAVLEEMASGKDLIEYKLALGADRSEATRELVSKGVRLAMLPVLNMMSVMGLVSIPGMMTGQILSGADPDIAARYQMMIVFVIAGTTSLAALMSVRLAVNSIVDRHHCFRPELLTKRSKVTVFSQAAGWISVQAIRMWSSLRSLCCCCCADNTDIEAPSHSSTNVSFSGPNATAKVTFVATGFAGLPRVGGAVDWKTRGNSDSLTTPLLQDAHDAITGNLTTQQAPTTSIVAPVHASTPSLTAHSQRDGSWSSGSNSRASHSLERREQHQIKAMHPAFMAPASGTGIASGLQSIAAAAAPSSKRSSIDNNTSSTALTGHNTTEAEGPAQPTVSLYEGLQTAAITSPCEAQALAQPPQSLRESLQTASASDAVGTAPPTVAGMFDSVRATAAADSTTKSFDGLAFQGPEAASTEGFTRTVGSVTNAASLSTQGPTVAAPAAPVLTPVQVLFAECLIPVVIPAPAHRQPLSEASAVQASSPGISRGSPPVMTTPISSPPTTSEAVTGTGGSVAEVCKAVMEMPEVVNLEERTAVVEAALSSAATTSTDPPPTPFMVAASPANSKPGPQKSAVSKGKKGKRK